MTTLLAVLANEPVRARVYGVLVALFPVLVAFGVDITDAQQGGLLAFAYVVLIGGTEAARAKVAPVAGRHQK